MNLLPSSFGKRTGGSGRFALGLFFTAVVPLFPADQPAALPVVSDRLSKEASLAFHYTPLSGENPATDSPSSAPTGTMTLEKLVVTHYNESHALELLLAEQAKRIREESFSWKEGGTILKKEGRKVTTEVKWKFNPERNAMDILSFSW
jgi:hypothetical protein